MSNYTKSTNFATKDTLTSGDPLKIVKGTEINTEFDAISTAIATKADTASPTFTGTVTIPTLSVSGTSTLTSQPILSSLTASKPVFTDSSKGLVSTGTLGADQGGTGVANNAAMTVTGSGNFAYTRTLTGTTNVTFPTTGTLATLAGSETFTNKTLTSPAIGGTPTGVGILTSGTAVASTSGTSISFSSIPSWVKRVTIMLAGVSTNGASNLAVQIGPVAGVETSGYSGYAYTPTSPASYTTEWAINGTNSAVNVYSGNVFLSLADSATNTWVMSSSGGGVGINTVSIAGGSKAIAGTLSVIRIIGSNTGSPVDTFDAGSINILYE